MLIVGKEDKKNAAVRARFADCAAASEVSHQCPVSGSSISQFLMPGNWRSWRSPRCPLELADSNLPAPDRPFRPAFEGQQCEVDFADRCSSNGQLRMPVCPNFVGCQISPDCEYFKLSGHAINSVFDQNATFQTGCKRAKKGLQAAGRNPKTPAYASGKVQLPLRGWCGRSSQAGADSEAAFLWNTMVHAWPFVGCAGSGLGYA